MNGKEINLTSDNTTIKSNNFNVDKYGNMTCNNANITGGSLNVGGSRSNPKIITSGTGISGFTTENRIAPDGLDIITNGINYINMYIGKFSDNSYTNVPNGYAIFKCANGQETYIRGTGITTPVLTQTSKKELKKNFEKLENALDIIKRTDIYKYNFKSESDGSKKHIGFVIGDNYNYAEEITSKENNGADIYSLASVCLKAIQEQQEQIELLQKETNKLKGESYEKN